MTNVPAQLSQEQIHFGFGPRAKAAIFFDFGSLVVLAPSFLAFLVGTLLLAPVVAFLRIITLSSANRSEVTAKLTTVFVVLLHLSILEHPQYILALTRYSAAATFSDRMTKFMTGYFLASILFHARQDSIYSPFLVEPAYCSRGELDML
jgi:hypothetical protein